MVKLHRIKTTKTSAEEKISSLLLVHQHSDTVVLVFNSVAGRIYLKGVETEKNATLKMVQMQNCSIIDHTHEPERYQFSRHQYIPEDFSIMNGKILEGFEKSTHDTSS